MKLRLLPQMKSLIFSIICAAMFLILLLRVLLPNELDRFRVLMTFLFNLPMTLIATIYFFRQFLKERSQTLSQIGNRDEVKN
jgi:hypothetical protein